MINAAKGVLPIFNHYFCQQWAHNVELLVSLKILVAFYRGVKMLKHTFIYLLTVPLSAVCGCSAEDVKRAGYGSLQYIGDQQCQMQYSSECPEPDSYDDYQRKRKEL